MSALFVINLKEPKIGFKKLNKLANKIIKFSLKNNIGVSFNCYDYYEKIIQEADMQNFFFVSESFLFKNCDILDTSKFINQHKPKKIFFSKFKFLKKLVSLIKKSGLEKIEVFLSGDSVEEISDFKEIWTKKENLLIDLYDELFIRENEISCVFPSLKINIKL